MSSLPTKKNHFPNEQTRPTFPWRNERGLLSYGAPGPELAAAHVKRLGKSRVFVVVSGSLAKNTDHFVKLKAALDDKVVGIHIGFRSHVPWNDVLVLAEEVRSSKADVVVTLGGGSITDAVKLVALILANDFVEDLESLEQLSKILSKTMDKCVDFASYSDPPEIKPATLGIINIPTTLSVGEYSPYAGGIDPRDGIKKMFVHKSIYADVVILDPVIAATVPEWVWMSSGVRAIDHCVETLGCLKEIDKQTKQSAEKGLVLIARGLLKLRKDPSDAESRLETQLGANYAIDGLCRGIHLGGSHAIGHQLGTMNVAHGKVIRTMASMASMASMNITDCAGHTSCVLCPSVMKYNALVNAKQQQLAIKALWSDTYITQVLSSRGLSCENNDLGDMLDGLFREYAMPRTLKEVGVEGNGKLETLAKRSLSDPWCQTNPIPLTTEEQVLQILRTVEA